MKNIHGEWELTLLKPGVILLKTSGAWNAEAGLACMQELKALVLSMEDQPWCLLGDFRQWGLSIPEMKAIAKAMIIWNEAHHCRGGAYLVTGHLQVEEVLRHLPEQDQYTYPRKICSSVDDAVSFLNQQGFTLSHKELESLAL